MRLDYHADIDQVSRKSEDVLEITRYLVQVYFTEMAIYYTNSLPNVCLQ